ncbi:MAG TPA: DUF4231 domain-containing protein [Terriglobales bacterium]|jgi:hypothetical protein|nr:DUF4231 domain-containing protein [Terriglobales bacterium]
MNDSEPDPIIVRLEEQIVWYDSKSTSNMHWFKRIKMTEIFSAAIIPMLAASHFVYAAVITGVLGVLITVFEGMLQLNQYHENWIRYRSTCESLKHEKYIFLASASPYGSAEKPRALLAERVESLVSQEHAKWESVQQEDPKGKSE